MAKDKKETDKVKKHKDKDKKHKNKDKDKDKDKKNKNKDKDKDKKNKNKDKDKDKDRDMNKDKDKKHKNKDKKHKKDKEEDEGAVEHSQISIDDYFSRSFEFRYWLRTAKGLSFESLTTEKSHELFKEDFVKKWNKGKLDPLFYTGLPKDAQDTIKSVHAWGMKLTDSERGALANTVTQVRDQTVSSDSSMLPHLVVASASAPTQQRPSVAPRPE